MREMNLTVNITKNRGVKNNTPPWPNRWARHNFSLNPPFELKLGEKRILAERATREKYAEVPGTPRER